MALSPLLVAAVGQFIDSLATYRGLFEGRRSAMLSGDVSFRIVEMTLEELARFRADIVDIKGRTGVGAYIQRFYGDATIDIVTRFNAVQTEVESTGLAIRTLMPKDVNGWVLAYQLSASPTDLGQFIWRTVTPAQTATVQADLALIVAAIDALYADLTG